MSEVTSFSVDSMVRALDAMQSAAHHHEECTWIAGTGKAELYVRDRIGANLAKIHPELIIAREWGTNKHDLAILNNRAEALAVVEGKHLFDFDLSVSSIRNRYQKWIQKDCEKLAASGSSQRLLTLLMTSFRGEVPPHLERVVKYGPGSNKFFKKHGYEATPLAVEEAGCFLEEFGSVVHRRELSVGHFHELPTCLWIWIVDTSR